MEGYGRWLALFIFLVLIFLSMLESWNKDRKEFWMHIFLLGFVPIGAFIVFSVAYFIFNYW